MRTTRRRNDRPSTTLATGRQPTSLRWIRRWACCLLMAWLVLPAQAQTLDDLTVLAQGGDTVARLSFNGNVRFLQLTPTTASDLYRISLELVSGDESVINQSTAEGRDYAGSGSVPAFKLSYAPNAGRRMKQLTLQLSRKLALRVRQGPTPRSIDIVFAGLQPQAAAAPPQDKRYVVLLQRVPVAEKDKLLPVPIRFQNLETLSTNAVVGGVEMLELSVGYFATEAEAESARKAALDRFPQALVVDIERRKAEVLAAMAAAQAQATPAAAPPPAPAPAASEPVPASPAPAAAPAVVASPDIEKRAGELMARGREALTGRRYEEAVNVFNQLLLLPPNSQSKDAQELIGVAWERAGVPLRAKAEYELYLKLFPGDEGAQRVAQRLASLDLGQAAPAQAARAADQASSAPPPAPNRYNGSIAQYYFGGKARSQSLVSDPNSGTAQSTLSKTTESAIVTSLDLGARYLTPDSETRVVLRGTGSSNLQSTSHNPSLVNAAYIDHKRTESGLAVRLGRQTAISGGLLGLFDGVSLSYPVRQGLKFDLMGGAPANTLVGAPAQRLLAGVMEVDGILDHWGGNLYVIDQTSEGIVNRRAIGSEIRYADDKVSLYSLFDYDTLFKVLNAVSVQGSIQAPGQTTITLLLDARKAPSLERTNALISTGAASLKELLQTRSLDEITLIAHQTSATAKQALLSLSRPISERWQLGMDLRYSAVGALPAVGDLFQATPATGAQYGVSTLLTGSNLYSSRDINTFGLSYLTTPSFKGTQLSYSNLTGLRGEEVTLEPSLRFYTQNSNDGTRTQRLTPGVRLSYKYSQRASLLGETIVERSKVDGPTERDSSTSVFFYLGYRYELF